MAEERLRQVRVLHLVSSEGASGVLHASLFLPLLTRIPKQHVKSQVIALAPDAVSGPMLRQSGVPVHDVALSRRRFSMKALSELLHIARAFRPDVIQAWGHTAQLASLVARRRSAPNARVIWSVASTAPLASKAGLIDRQKLKYTTRFSPRPDRIVYTSEASAVLHRRAGYPEEGYAVIPPGVDATRFKSDPQARKRVREELELPDTAYVIGMVAPFQPEYDHATLLKAMGDLIKLNPNIHLLLCGHGVQKGNAALMALVGGGSLAKNVQVLGEWSDVASLFNACDVVCSSALTDASRLTLVMAMLCGVPCVATGMGAQGEVIGQHGVAIEPGSPSAFVRGIGRIMELTDERRAYLIQGARKHALKKFVQVSSLQKYLQLYHELVGRQALEVEQQPEPKPERTAALAAAPPPRKRRAPAPPPLTAKEIAQRARAARVKNSSVAIDQLADPDSLENTIEAEAFVRRPPPPERDADVLVSFEASIAEGGSVPRSRDGERARGVAEEMEDLLAPEELNTPALEAAPKKPEAVAVAPVVPKPEPAPASEPVQLQLVPDPPAEAPKQAAG